MTDRSDEIVELILKCCARPGMSAINSRASPYQIIEEVLHEMEASTPSEPFPELYVEFVAHSIKMTIHAKSFLDADPAVASVYLATRFENYFRHLSGKLGGRGGMAITSG